MRLATRNIRLINFLLDIIFLNVAMFVVWLTFVALGYMGVLEKESMAIAAFLLLFYYLIFESIWGKSPAKFVTRTRVSLTDGKKPSLKDIFIRSVCRFIPLEPLSYLFSQHPVGWHDKFSGTVVVEDES